MKALRVLLAALVASLLTSAAAIAHHSFAMFDRTVEKVITGTVVRWQFNSPHSWLYLNVKSPDGTETLWSFEGSAPPSLLPRGITGSSFEPGSTITISHAPMKDGRRGVPDGRGPPTAPSEPVRRRLRRQRESRRE
jgi:hypothetical protein